MNKYKVVLFDVDGVLIVPPKLFSEQYCEKYGIDDDKQVKFYATEEFKQALLGKFDLKDALKIHNDLWQWKGTSEELMDMWFMAENYPNKPLLDLAAQLRQDGIRIYLATQQEQYRKKWIEDVAFKDMLDGVFCSCDLGYNKHENHFWKAVLDKLSLLHPGINSHEIAYLDDKQTLVDKAHEFGIDAYLYTKIDDAKTVLAV